MPKSRSRKSAYHHGALREALLEAALQLLDEDGVAGLTLRAAARRAGVSHAAPYHHFSSKEALIAEVAIQGFGALKQCMEAAPDFAATGRAYVAFAVDRAAQFRVMFRLDLSQPGMEAARQAGVACFEVLRRQVATSYPGDTARAIEQRALSGWALAHGVATLWTDGPLATVLGPRVDVEALAAQLIRPKPRTT